MAKMDYSKRNRQDAVTRSFVRHVQGAPRIVTIRAKFDSASPCPMCDLPMRRGQLISAVRPAGRSPVRGSLKWHHTSHDEEA